MAETIEQIPEWMLEELKEMILRQVIAKNARERLAIGWGEILPIIRIWRHAIEEDWEHLAMSGDDLRAILPPLGCEFCGKKTGKYGKKTRQCRRGCGPPLECEFCGMEIEKCERDGWWRCLACGKKSDKCDC